MISGCGITGCGSERGSTPAVPAPSAAQSNPSSPSLQVAEIYTQLRSTALSVLPEHVGVSHDQSDQTLALVADWRMGEQQQATVVCLADGGASIYFNNGGGMIGGIGHDDVRDQVAQTLDLVHEIMPHLEPVIGVPDTLVDHMRFTRITAEGKSTAMFSVENLVQEDHDFFELASSVQAVISLMRTKQEQP